MNLKESLYLIEKINLIINIIDTFSDSKYYDILEKKLHNFINYIMNQRNMEIISIKLKA